MPTFRKETRIEASAGELFDWHLRAFAFERLTPPWLKVEVLDRSGTISEGGRVRLRVADGNGVTVGWELEHCDYIEGEQFEDRQIAGPFKFWRHLHKFSDSVGGAKLVDEIEYELPDLISSSVTHMLISNKLEQLFKYRHETTSQDLSRFMSSKGREKMKVAVTGASGLVGSTLLPFLSTQGHDVLRVVRGAARSGSGNISWDPASGKLDCELMAGVGAVVHLAGENIASGRWSQAKKAQIKTSRIESTKKLCQSLATMKNKPSVLVCASAIGFYGDRGDALLDESSHKGDLYLSDVCREWEAATRPATEAGIRVVNLRIGVVISPCGGALAKMLPVFKIGGGGPIGDGRQWMSWISIDDLAGVIQHCLLNENLVGPVNAVAPNPVRNKEFAQVLGKVISRPAFAPLPAFAARVMFGEMADELLLASTRVQPGKLLETGYTFSHPTLEQALSHLLGSRGGHHKQQRNHVNAF